MGHGSQQLHAVEVSPGHTDPVRAETRTIPAIENVYEVSGAPSKGIAQKRMSRGVNFSMTIIAAPQFGQSSSSEQCAEQFVNRKAGKLGEKIISQYRVLLAKDTAGEWILTAVVGC